MAPRVNYTLDPGPPRARIQPARAPCDLTFVLYKMSRFLTGDDEARRETARAADRKRLGRQNEVDVRCLQRLAITRAGYVLKLPNCIKASREASLHGQPHMH